MNKFGIVLGIAAVATLAGCKDPDYKYDNSKSQNEVKKVDTTSTTTTTTVTASPAKNDRPAAPATPKCTCLPGTKHTEPCKCGDPNCKCIVVPKTVVTADLTKPAEPEYTVYTVQSGDYLAKISKKYNVTISSIKRLNPSIKDDNVVRIGQKLKIPGKVDVPVVAATPAAAKTVAKKTTAAAAYTGATKEYVVKNGDTLGSIAYGNGINIRQLKALNNLTSDTLKVGQKLKIPAEKAAAAVAPAKKPVAAAAVQKKPAEAAKPAEAPKPAEAEAPAESVAAAPDATEEAPAAEVQPAEEAKPAEPAKEAKPATTTYVVQEGDDMTGVSIRWGVSAAEIRELNNLAEGDQLKVGQIIKLPADAQQ